MKQPGEARDQRLWTDALAALKPERFWVPGRAGV